MKKIFFTGVMSLLMFAPIIVLANMTSTNYSIIFDSIGVNGGDYITSTSYSISETIGETPVINASSTSYYIEGGYQTALYGTLSFTLSQSSLNLGTLSTGAVNSASTIATITSDSSGYILSINNVSGAMPAAVIGGAVVAGTEAYGFSASGLHSVVIGDVPVAGGTVISSTTAPVINDTTNITLKASISGASAAGNYNQTIDLVASVNY